MYHKILDLFIYVGTLILKRKQNKRFIRKNKYKNQSQKSNFPKNNKTFRSPSFNICKMMFFFTRHCLLLNHANAIEKSVE